MRLYYIQLCSIQYIPSNEWGSLAHMCPGLWPVKSLRPSDAYMRQWNNHHWFRRWLVACPVPTITRTNTGILLIGSLGTDFSDILIKIYTFLLKKMHMKMSPGKWRSSCLGLNVLSSFRICMEKPAHPINPIEAKLDIYFSYWTSQPRFAMITLYRISKHFLVFQ